MASTFRFPDDLKAEATAYAARLGVSLNALCAVALRDYLDARKGGGQAPEVPAALPAAPPALQAAAPAAPRAEAAKADRGPVFGLGESLRESVPLPHRVSKKRRKR